MSIELHPAAGFPTRHRSSEPEDGQLVLRLTDVLHPKGFQKIDLSAWLRRPRLAAALKAYFETCLAGLSPGYRSAQREMLDVFRDYLDERFNTVDLPELTTLRIAFYEDWLDEQTDRRSKDGSGALWSVTTKSVRWNALIQFLDFCLATPGFRDELPPDLEYRSNRWPQAYLQTKSHEPIPKIELVRIREACIEEIRETKRRLLIGARVAADDTIAIPDQGEASAAAYDDRDVRLRALISRHKERGPSHDRIHEEDPGLARSVLKSKGRGFEIASHLHLTARTLVPFVLLLTIDTAFNPETILNIDLRDIEREHFLYGKDRWVLGGDKARAGRRQYRSFWAHATDDDSPVQILKTLVTFGAYARSRLPPAQMDRVFAFWQLRGKAFASFTGRLGYKTFNRALDDFREDHKDRGLPPFTLATLRATVAEGVFKATNDPKAVQVALGHKRLSTTLRSYDSKASKRRRRETLAVSIDLRERYARSDGAADMRNGMPLAGNATAATPGFGCTKPRFSPVPGQEEGQPCHAYGACPTCELAFVDLNDSLACRRLLQLRARLVEARKVVHPARWVEVMQPRLAALEDAWLPAFAEGVVGEALSRDVQPIPRIE